MLWWGPQARKPGPESHISLKTPGQLIIVHSVWTRNYIHISILLADQDAGLLTQWTCNHYLDSWPPDNHKSWLCLKIHCWQNNITPLNQTTCWKVECIRRSSHKLTANNFLGALQNYRGFLKEVGMPTPTDFYASCYRYLWGPHAAGLSWGWSIYLPRQ